MAPSAALNGASIRAQRNGPAFLESMLSPNVDAQPDGLMPPADATTIADATAMTDMAWAPNTWTSFGQSFVGGSGICQQVDSGSGKSYFLTTTVSEMPYHCQLAVDFPTKPTADALYKVSSINPPGPAGTAYALILDYRTGSYESWHSRLWRGRGEDHGRVDLDRAAKRALA
jgi:hypothetical protein